MAVNHIQFDRSSVGGQGLVDMLTTNEQGDLKMAQRRDQMLSLVTLVSGNPDPSQIANFDEVVKFYGVLGWVANNAVTDPQRTEAQRMWNEMDSAYSKTSGDGSVSNVHAARQQLYSKLRG